MSTFGISDSQLESLIYPNGRGQYHYGNTPININTNPYPVNGVQSGGVSMIGNTPVRTGVVATTNPAIGVTAGQTAATGIPAGAAMGGVGAGAGGAAGMMGGMGGAGGAAGYANVAGAAINQIAQVANDYFERKKGVDTLKNTQAIPEIPESQGALAGWMPPPVPIR